MNLSEYESIKDYLVRLKNDKSVETVKPKEFYTIMSSELSKYPGIMVRDYLDIDGTFSVILKNYVQSPYEILNCYQTIRYTLEDMLYTDTILEGLVKLEGYEGFWIKLG